jgi:G3E family GTPase
VLDLFRSSELGPFGRRQRHPRGHRVPVTIETGSPAAHGHDTFAVLDEFGADDLAPLRNGCACCSVRVKLQDRLRGLLAERAEGKVRHFSRIAIQTEEAPAPIRRTFASPHALEAEFYLEGDPLLAEDAHADGIVSFTLTDDAPVAWEAFRRFITTLMALRGADLVWVKGLLNVEGCLGPVVVQFVQHLAHRPIELAAWPDANRNSQVVVVARNIEEHAVRALFDAVRAIA